VQVGDTVSLRVQADAGPTEVVGTVLAASADALTVRRRDGSVVELDVQVRDAPDPQARTQLVADERHRVAESSQGGLALGRLTDHTDPNLRVTQVVGRLDARDRREPDPRIRDLTTDDRPDLLPEKFVDPLGSLAHDNRMAATNASWSRPG